MLENSVVATRLLTRDLQRVRAFYAGKLSLEPSEERPGGPVYHCAGGEFALFEGDGTATLRHSRSGS